MILSKERLIKEQNITGFRQEIIEKVSLLMHILNHIANDNYLKSRLVLKGGTALNLFHSNLPRLSVDADLNYIGQLDREEMLKEKPEIEARLYKLLQTVGLIPYRNPSVHAGGKMIWRYPSALGNQGNIEIDLNFMYRKPLMPIELKDSVKLANRLVKNMPVLNIHELAAGKLTALINRGAGRDIFDVYQLFQNQDLNINMLRFCFVVYAAMNYKKNYLNLSIKDINFNKRDLQNKLIPVLNGKLIRTNSIQGWANTLLKGVRENFTKLIPFGENERKFIQEVYNNGAIIPELITNNPESINIIKCHPAVQWSASKSKRQYNH